ncbi:MAG TPA: hypothetical protein VHY82_01625 [Acetobacteraceae bacterium]|nr:hypothetical protein [Acetobacteraceae bacterium]
MTRTRADSLVARLFVERGMTNSSLIDWCAAKARLPGARGA